MEKARNNSKVKIPKAKALDENISPMKIEMDDQLFTGRGRFHQSMTLSPSFQPYAENLDVSSPLVRYFRAGSPISSKVSSSGESFTSPTFGSSKYRSAIVQQYNSNSSGNTSFGSRGRFSLSPLSSIENLDIAPLMSPPVYRTPVKVDEEVLVMDDIQVRSTSGGKSGRSSSASCGGAFSSSSSSGKSMFKTDICRAWEESGNCRYFSKCQFAHGKQELRPTRLSIKDKSEAQASKSSSSTRSCTNGPRSRTGNQFQAADGSEDAVTTSQPASPVKPEPDHTLANFNHISDWSPLDDDIELELPHYGSAKHPSREEVDAYIFSILHGPTSKRRLPAFVELCSEQDIHD